MPDVDPREDRPTEPTPDSSDDFDASEENGDHIPRAKTVVRILLSLVFMLLVRVAETVLAVVIVFELIFTLITERPPTREVRRFANRVLSYLVTIVRYLTYESECPPFPFSELPPELDYTPKDPAAV